MKWIYKNLIYQSPKHNLKKDSNCNPFFVYMLQQQIVPINFMATNKKQITNFSTYEWDLIHEYVVRRTTKTNLHIWDIKYFGWNNFSCFSLICLLVFRLYPFNSCTHNVIQCIWKFLLQNFNHYYKWKIFETFISPSSRKNGHSSIMSFQIHLFT